MKKILSFMLVLLVLAGSVTACGAGTPAGTSVTASATNGTTQKPASSTGGWSDTPAYPGATQTQGGQIAPPPGSGISKVEVRYYETSDSADKVENFYKAQLPANGWQSQGWTEVGMMAGVYTNNNGTESLQISILPPGPGGKTVITLARGTK